MHVFSLVGVWETFVCNCNQRRLPYQLAEDGIAKKNKDKRQQRWEQYNDLRDPG